MIPGSFEYYAPRSLGDAVKQVFELAGFLPLFSIEGSRDGAVRAVASR